MLLAAALLRPVKFNSPLDTVQKNSLLKTAQCFVVVSFIQDIQLPITREKRISECTVILKIISSVQL